MVAKTSVARGSRQSPGRRTAVALSLAHGINDMYMGFLPGLLPLLVARMDLSLTRVGLTVTLIGLVSNFLQPVFGHLGDRVGRRALAVAGPMVTALSMSCLGVVGSYRALLLVLTVGGIGNATFHPVAASLAGRAARGKSSVRSPLRGDPRSSCAEGARVMAFFVAGGNLGFGSGPLLAITFVGLFGLERTWLTAVAGIAVGVFLFVSVPRSDSRPAEDTGPYEGLQVLAWLAPMLTLYLVVTLRAAAAITFTTFVPLLCERRGEPLALGGFTLLGFSLAGAVGGIAGGLAVRRLQQRWVTAVTLALAAGCFLVFLRADGVAAAVMALALGACLFAALPVNIVMAQQLLPRHATAASGLVMGAAWAVGSFSATGVGALADFLARSAPAAAALGRAMEWSVLLLLVAAALACLLPELEARDT